MTSPVVTRRNYHVCPAATSGDDTRERHSPRPLPWNAPMSSRREFVSMSAVGIVATKGLANALPAQAGPLPPAIKALKSMKTQAKPITIEERRGRLEKARQLMRANGIDALMLTGGTSMEYFTGIRWGLSERLLAAVIPSKGSAFLVTPKFEEERAMEQAHQGPLGGDADVYAWEEDESPQ